MKTGFIGAGKAGCSLSRYLAGSQTTICGFYSKTPEHSRQAADYTRSAVFFNLEEVVQESDMIFVTTPDSVIEQVWEGIKHLEDKGSVGLKGKIFCHVSGSLSSQIFCGAKERGVFVCAAHPMQAISSKDTDLTGAFFTLDGDDQAVGLVKGMLEKKGNPTAVIAPASKKKYHMAASCASNLVAGLAQIAVDALTDCGFSQEGALSMLTPLMLGNMKNICEKGPMEALTGPVERCDCNTVKAHIDQLNGEEQTIYRLLSLRLIQIAQKKNPTRDYSKLKLILEEKDQ
ncbi:F420-dependent NADP oxidoreductase [Ihubacter massiliensis]|uniref:F420-dependent NADP oxidoreductase n=1 Tax=Hominibacterium faecale TaxID=2839743 RepID=A0A9J6QK47_9FIRM|nr:MULTISPECIES: Rossmann-like and DUF2520 domain-containing protein [Eubacteriales Family XIII. Incertae Sedis]MCO7120932.1 F420-dependent NADP oxidoreductase [Ihubacter massiliensis]MCU7377848.1 F420-dependent NADP oxidoreductase [Hominibacterium faecale]MDE8732888.1 DUF2520 domain-containing protein [Eubacteriales bacterium DFI.9.88]